MSTWKQLSEGFSLRSQICGIEAWDDVGNKVVIQFSRYNFSKSLYSKRIKKNSKREKIIATLIKEEVRPEKFPKQNLR